MPSWNMSDTNGRRLGNMRMNSEWIKHLRIEHLIAGTAGGVSATLVLHPLDLIKIRFQGL